MVKVKRAYYEAVVQKVLPSAMQNRDFEVTSNARNEAMFLEASQFAKWLVTVEKNVETMEKAIDKHMNDMQAFLQSSLPQEYAEGVPGQAVPTEIEAQAVGAGVNLDQLALAPQELKTKMNSDVLQPLRNWLTGFSNIKIRMKEVESLRLEVDSRRRTSSSMTKGLEQTRSKHYSKGIPNEATEEKLEKWNIRAKHKTSKANSALTQYKELEADTYNQLTDLVKDTVYVKQYMAEAMLILAEGFTLAYQAFQGRPPLSENRANLQVPAQDLKLSEVSQEVEGKQDVWVVIDGKPIMEKKSQELNPFEQRQSQELNTLDKRQSQELNPFEQRQSQELDALDKRQSQKLNPFDQRQLQELYPQVERQSQDLNPFEKRQSQDMNPFEKRQSQDLNPFEKRQSQDLNPFEKRQSIDANPFEKRQSIDVNPFEKRTSLDANPFEKRTSLDANPFEKRTSLDVNPFEKRTSLDVNPFGQRKYNDNSNSFGGNHEVAA